MKSPKPQYLLLTLKVTEEEHGYSAVCVELDTASCGDTVEEAFSNLIDAVQVDLSTLEHFGELETFFKKRNIRVYDAPDQIDVALPKVTVDIGETITRKVISLQTATC